MEPSSAPSSHNDQTDSAMLASIQSHQFSPAQPVSSNVVKSAQYKSESKSTDFNSESSSKITMQCWWNECALTYRYNWTTSALLWHSKLMLKPTFFCINICYRSTRCTLNNMGWNSNAPGFFLVFGAIQIGYLLTYISIVELYILLNTPCCVR